jgi:hypothetical protein
LYNLRWPDRCPLCFVDAGTGIVGNRAVGDRLICILKDFRAGGDGGVRVTRVSALVPYVLIGSGSSAKGCNEQQSRHLRREVWHYCLLSTYLSRLQLIGSAATTGKTSFISLEKCWPDKARARQIFPTGLGSQFRLITIPLCNSDDVDDDAVVARGRGRSRRAVIASTVGTTIEWYDFLIYNAGLDHRAASAEHRRRRRLARLALTDGDAGK